MRRTWYIAMPIQYVVLLLLNYDYLQGDTNHGTYVHSTAKLRILVAYNDTF